MQAFLGHGEGLEFRDSTFDYIAMIFTLCFAKNPKKIIEESKRVLKNDGKLIVGIVDKNSFLGRSYQEKSSIFYKHAHLFSPEEVTAMLESCGFKDFSYLQTLFDYPEKINAVQATINGHRRGAFIVISAVKKEY